MTNLVETSGWDLGVLQFATTDPIQGGPGGIDNQPHQSVANRTLWLRNRIGAAITQAGLTEGSVDNQQLAEAVVLQCASIVALRAVPVPVVPGGQTVLILTRGQSSDGDGLGAAYKWNSASTVADNGLTVVAPTGIPGAGRWVLSGINATNLNGQSAANFLTAAQAASIYETIADASAKLTAAETFASGVAATAQSNAQTFASGVAATAQSNAQTFASGVATTAQNAAIASATSFATTAANNALASANAAAANGSNISGGTVAAARLPLIGNLAGVVIQADPGGTPSGFAPGTMVFYF